ncbi:MAG: DUF924 domain-containing protein [Cellvibrionaceae bacterium]
MDMTGIIQFWFQDIAPAQWWQKSDEFDREIEHRFGELHMQATRGELFAWRQTAKGRLAEIIVLDQFSRNIFRDKPQAFAFDGMALVLSQEAVALGMDAQLSLIERSFLYMPYMHSESLSVHDEAIKLFDVPGLENNYQFEIKHREIIEKFGRYPHRNVILGRDSTVEEIEFLKQPGSSF